MESGEKKRARAAREEEGKKEERFLGRREKINTHVFLPRFFFSSFFLPSFPQQVHAKKDKGAGEAAGEALKTKSKPVS